MGLTLDDDWENGPMIRRAGTAAFGLYSRCGLWVARHLTDGFVPADVAADFGTREWAAKLVEAGLWGVVEGGFQDLHYLRLNPTAEVVRRRRAQGARRQALVRDPALRDAVRARDKDRCRYCGVQVRWSDRKGPKGGTYDHVDPEGPNSFDNLVVCCRSCNSAKRDRTPAVAGMPLRPAPGSNLDTNRVGPGSDPVSSQPPALPKGRGSPAPNGAARDSASPIVDTNPDWRSLPAYGAPPDPLLADRTRRGADAVRTALNGGRSP